jgi:hydroxymethylglutaryl-CoA reductase (NADPH)
MPTDARKASAILQQILHGGDVETLASRLRPRKTATTAKVPGGARLTKEALSAHAGSRGPLADAETVAQMERYQHNIENFIGTVKVPLGLAGPLRVNGLFAQGDYYLPLATTEAALVASYNRGSLVITEAGGCSVMLLNEGVSRAPGFAFRNVEEVGRFIVWALSQQERFRQVAEGTTRHGRLADMRFAVEGNHVYLIFEFTTGSAAGQNMVTIATEAICEFIQENAPLQPRYFFVEANLSGDKKASALSFMNVRGKKVVAEITVAAELVKRFLHTTPEMMVNYWRMSALGGVMSGTIGVQGHYANGLAALFIACGQDVACVSEIAVGITRFELTEDGALYAAVSLPNLIVGTVGGGTGLPSQRACLEILGLAGPDHAQAFAEVCGGLALAGELSIIAALSSHEFARAHLRLARGRKKASDAKQP